MKPEPLKDKEQDFNYVNWYNEEDIKSAVEWLHNKLEELDSEYASTEMTDVGYSMSVRGLVNKAFEDVTKVVDVSPPEEQEYKEQLEDLGEEALKEDIEAAADLKRKEFKDGYFDDKLE